ncbi:VOC family protein [Streptomyces sp. SID161]|uniref:VOC family protein n=1 Tax=Streptomyces sp. SID161 TaxID=2690251 RepID=UPI001370703B|nr:VOC family protein [Streptomyces sp. SID161]MYW48182.1 VOC family protein [Streptomyces sp. SID161]
MMIRWTYAFADRPAARLADACAFWTAATGTRLSGFRGDGEEFVTLLPEATDPSVKLQGVGAGDGGAHLDLCTEDVHDLGTRARRLGARLVADHGDWAVLRSPAGRLFCVVPWQGEAVRPPVVSGSRLDQVCLDVPPSRYDTECAFWAALTGWEQRAGSRPEFTALVPPAGLPHRLLLQRLDEEGPASAHLDLACADVSAVRARHEELGAVLVREGAHWTVMRDPAGGTYCLTGRDPQTGRLPGRGGRDACTG